jgi:anti-sigma factor RsiW
VTNLHPRPAELLAASLDRSLTVDERAEVRDHLIRCADCRALELHLREDAVALSVPLRISPPHGIQAEIERRIAIPPVDPDLVRALRIAVAGAVLLIGIVVLAMAVALIQPRPTTPLETREPEPAGFQLSEGTR